jgi:DNA-binding response OmpR family regulator
VKILLIEDDRQTADYIAKGLREHGHVVDHAANGRDGLFLAAGERYDVMVVDRMLPGMDGLSLIKTVRATGVKTPVLFLTTMGGVEDRVAGFEAGGDDYLVKPFAFAELLARLRALLRRDVSGRELVLRADDLEVDLLTRRVVRGGLELDLTRREYELLEYLLRHKNATVTRDMIARDVWKEATGAPTNAIDVYITLLRKKVERAGARQLIHTVRGVGYGLRDGS